MKEVLMIQLAVIKLVSFAKEETEARKAEMI